MLSIPHKLLLKQSAQVLYKSFLADRKFNLELPVSLPAFVSRPAFCIIFKKNLPFHLRLILSSDFQVQPH